MKKLCRMSLSGLILLCLSLSLTSCVTRIAKPSDDLLQDCSITYLGEGSKTGGDLVRLAEDRRYDVMRCNVDKAALRAYYDQLCKGYRNRCSDERGIFGR